MDELYVDPPNGAEFGFPKRFLGDPDTVNFDQWLLDNGYPQAWIDLFPGGVPCRVIGGENGRYG